MRRLVCAVIFLTLILASLAGAATKYVIKDLGVLPGDDSSSASAINNKGQVVGVSWSEKDTSNDGVYADHPFIWDNGRLTRITALKGNEWLSEVYINDDGTILVQDGTEAYIVRGDSVKKVEHSDSYYVVQAYAIDSRGAVLGDFFNIDGSSRCCFWESGMLNELYKFSGVGQTYTPAANDKGQVVWTSESPNGRTRVSLWENGKVQILKDVPKSCITTGISADGTIVGFISEGEGLVKIPQKPFVWRSGAVEYLEPPKGLKGGSAECINKSGTIGGWCEMKTGDESMRAVVWDKDGTPTELPRLGGTDSEARDINDAGVIIGWATDKKDKEHAVLWTPVK